MLKYGYNEQQYKRYRSHAWRSLLLFSLLYCAHYCCRLNLAGAQVAMTEFTSEDIGILTSALFWCYGFGHLVNGRLGEIVGVRRFIILSVLLSVAANFVMGFQSSIVMMAVVWGFNGFFQSMAWSPGISSLNQWWPSDRRGFAVGFANAFSGFGQVAATAMVALSFALLPQYGWRSAFYLPALLPLVMVVIYMLFSKPNPTAVGLPEYKENNPEQAQREAEMAKVVKEKGVLYPYLYLLKKPAFLFCMLLDFSCGIARYGLSTWIPKYFNEVAQLGPVVSLLTSTILPIGMGIGTLLVPTLTDRFCPNNRLLGGVISGFCAALCIMGVFLVSPVGAGLYVVMTLLFFAGFFIYATIGVVWALAANIGGRVFGSTASGMLDWAAYMGASLQALIYGALLANGNWNILFISVSVFCVAISMLSFVASKVSKKFS